MPRRWTTGFVCPHCQSSNRRLFRATQAFPAYRCHDGDGYYTVLTDTVFAKTRQRPATVVLLLRGVAQGETTARLARELAMSYNQVLTLRQRLQDHANETAPMTLMEGTHFESDEVYQNAGEKGDVHSDPLDPPRRRGNAKPGHGTFANDRPPVFQIIRRATGDVRVIVCDTANKETCQGLLCQLLPVGSILYSDELSGYQGWPDHFTVCHSQKEYARDADGDGIREVHGNTCEGAHTALRTFLRRFQGVHKAYLACYLAVYEAIRNAKRITPEIIRRFCFGTRLHAS